MIGNGICRTKMRCIRRTRPHGPAASHPVRSRPAIAATALLFALALQCFDLRAELLFRSAEQRDGRQQWSGLRKYANPADTAYPRTRADGARVSSEEVQVFVRGYITREDVYGAKVMESLIRRGRQRIAGNAVSLAGSGGDVDAAMELGRSLRRLGVSTFVAPEARCLSSCVFAFMGGDRRTAGGRIGIHRPYFSTARNIPDRRLYYRRLQKRLQDYIDELDFPRSLYEALMAVPPESIRMLTAAELKIFYLQGMSPSTEDWADAAAARKLGISVSDYLPQKARSLSCADVADTACSGLAQQAGSSGAAADARSPQNYESAPPAVGSFALPEKPDAERPEAGGGVADPPRTSF